MNQIAALLPVGNILLDLDAGSKARLFDAVGALFETSSGLAPKIVVGSLVAREKLGSTGLGQGIAIPHGRIKGLKDAQGAFLRLATPSSPRLQESIPANTTIIRVPRAALLVRVP